jgi:hypothetical protein
LVVREGIRYRYVSTCFLSVAIPMSEQVVPSTVSQWIIVKFVTNENVKHAEILTRLGDGTLSSTQVYDWSKLFKEGQAEVENMRRLHLLQGKLWLTFSFSDSQGVLCIDFLIEQRTINAAYYSKLLKDRVKPTFRSKRPDRSVKSVCLLHDNARPHTAAVTAGQEHRRRCIGRYRHIPPVVLAWRQAIFTSSVHPNRP